MSEAAVRTPLPIEYPEEEVYSISDLGEGLSLKNRRTVELTPSFASSFLEQYAEFRVGDSKVDRPLDEGHVIHLAREMVGKTFLWEQVTLVLGELEGREYRLNGQHTCFPAGTAIRMADGSQKAIEKITVTDSVLTAENRVRSVRQIHSYEHKGELARIRLWGHGHLKCTPDHKILTKRGYIEACRLNPDDWVKIPRYAPPRVIHGKLPMIDRDSTWRRVRSVELEPFFGLVYDIGVEEDHSYVAEGIGVHNCWAVLYADEQGLPKETRRPVQLHRYSCQSMEDMRRLYASLDAAKPRSQHDKIAALLSGSDAFPGYKRGHLAHLAQGLALWLWPSGTTRGLHRASERAYLLLKDYHKVALVAGSIMRESKPADYRHLKRAAVMGAMLATCEKAPQIAVEFWRTIRDGLGLVDKEDPRLVLRNWLLTASLVGAEGVVGNAKVVGQEEMYRACIHAWNAYRTNRRIKQIRVALAEERPQPK